MRFWGLGRARLALGRPRDALEPLEQAHELWQAWNPEAPSRGKRRFGDAGGRSPGSLILPPGMAGLGAEFLQLGSGHA